MSDADDTANASEGRKIAILIVDDDPTNLFVLDEFLRGAGYPTLTATNGAEAVEAYRDHRPPLVLMDLSMPVMDGFEATRRILEMAPPQIAQRPIILAVSANVTPEWRSKCLDVGMDDFFEKPINFDVLIPRIGELVETLRR